MAQEILTDAKEEGRRLIMITLDDSKAFDSVCHIKLKRKCYSSISRNTKNKVKKDNLCPHGS